MAFPILLCTDGSDESLGALAAGLDLLGRHHDLALVTVLDAPDEGALAGSGHAGPELSPEEFDDRVARAGTSAEAVIDSAQRELALAHYERHILRGDPGPAICQLAVELSARAIVLGSRGRGGLRRAFLGSVSDQVVRNAPCSVIVTRI
jgi:nucleotide-binding universal stress UspA family protein